MAESWGSRQLPQGDAVEPEARLNGSISLLHTNTEVQAKLRP